MVIVRYAAMVIALASLGCGDNDTARTFPEGGYARLSETGLYSDISTRTVAPDSRPYRVAHVLWSDGAEKNRWLYLPPGSRIDSSDMDAWQLPVGAQLFKEFVRDGVLVETRLIERIDDTGNRESDFWVGAFLWKGDDSDANFVVDGAENGRGTAHDVPGRTDCWRCHRGQEGNVLGLAAVQLAHDGDGVTLDSLARDGQLSDEPELEVGPPGGPVAQRALGYLHANCGHCHNPRGIASTDTDMHLQLSVDDKTAEQTAIYRSTANVPLQYWTATQDAFDYRMVPGEPDSSALYFRMTSRDFGVSMPPLATEDVHPDGIDAIRAWIQSL